MNIWIVDHYSSEPQYGGIQRQFDFLNEMTARGHNVVVISSSFSHFTHKYISQDEVFCSEINSKGHYVYLRTKAYSKNDGFDRTINTLSFMRIVPQKAALIKAKYGKPDVVVGCSIHPFTWIAAYRVSKEYKARFVAEVRDLWPATWIYNWGMSRLHPRAIIFGGIEKWAYKKAEIITGSINAT